MQKTNSANNARSLSFARAVVVTKNAQYKALLLLVAAILTTPHAKSHGYKAESPRPGSRWKCTHCFFVVPVPHSPRDPSPATLSGVQKNNFLACLHGRWCNGRRKKKSEEYKRWRGRRRRPTTSGSYWEIAVKWKKAPRQRRRNAVYRRDELRRAQAIFRNDSYMWATTGDQCFQEWTPAGPVNVHPRDVFFFGGGRWKKWKIPTDSEGLNASRMIVLLRYQGSLRCRYLHVSTLQCRHREECGLELLRLIRLVCNARDVFGYRVWLQIIAWARTKLI